MRTMLVRVTIALVIVLLLAAPVSLPTWGSDEDLCRPRVQVLERLDAEGFEPEGAGVTVEFGHLYQLYIHSEQALWVLWFDIPDQALMCPVAIGSDWRQRIHPSPTKEVPA